MQINIEISEREVRTIIAAAMSEEIGKDVKPDEIKIYVKSKQNYKSEWEHADFKAEYRKAM